MVRHSNKLNDVVLIVSYFLGGGFGFGFGLMCGPK
jgi:hypothetical protein